jgi:hypothetical protein
LELPDDVELEWLVVLLVLVAVVGVVVVTAGWVGVVAVEVAGACIIGLVLAALFLGACRLALAEPCVEKKMALVVPAATNTIVAMIKSLT